MNKNILYLLTIISAIDRIYIFKKGFNSASDFYFANSKLNFNAVVNLLSAIGEEVKKIDDILKLDSGYLYWNDIVGLRNNLVHNYRGIDKDILWETINSDLEPLKSACIIIFKKIKPNKDTFESIINEEYFSHIAYLTSELY